MDRSDHGGIVTFRTYGHVPVAASGLDAFAAPVILELACVLGRLIIGAWAAATSNFSLLRSQNRLSVVLDGRRKH